MAADATVAYGLIDDGALAVDVAGTILWCGPRTGLPRDVAAATTEERDAGGRLIAPGFVDCHTHLVFAGNRAREFEMRLNGAHYADIARAGGGILSTVRSTRAASPDVLETQSERRLRALARSGVTTVEIKSGYGLDGDTELAMLRAAKALGSRGRARVVATYLGLHSQPPEYATADAYVDFAIERVLPVVKAEGLANVVDAFCETVGFSAKATARFFDAAVKLGFRVKLHADQLTDGGGAALAAHYGALSADHLEHASRAGLEALARSGTVAVLLPAATYYLRETRLPPVEALRALGVPIAIATDCNPGTAPIASMPLALNMACTILRLTPEEALAGATRHGARALGLHASLGTLEAGKTADFTLWDLEHPAEIVAAIGSEPYAVVRDGVVTN